MASLPGVEATPLIATSLSGPPSEPDLFLSRLYLPITAQTILSGDPAGESWLRATYGKDIRVVDCSPRIILSIIEQRFRGIFRERAVCELAGHEPQFSASVVITPGQIRVCAAILCLAAWMLVAVPESAGILMAAMCVGLFLANSVFRALLLWAGADFWATETSPPASLPDVVLPVYSILVPLFREANVMPALLRALHAIDYPGIR